MTQWKLVPVEYTRAMIASTVDAVFGGAIEDASIIGEVYDAMLAAAPPAPSAEPYAWHYWNIGGGSTWHRGPSKRLDADIAAAKEYPRAHHLTPLYAAPPDHLAVMRQALDALEQLQGGCTDSDDGTVEAITVWCPEVIDALRAALEGKR